MLASHIHKVVKRGCIIVTCDPATQTIEAKIQRGEIIPVNAFYFTPFFRWPEVNEHWILREEQGSWFLDSIFQEQEVTRSEEAITKINAEANLEVRLEPVKV